MPVKWTKPKKAEKRAEARRSDIGERANREARRSDASSEGKPAPKGKGKKEAK